MAKRDVDSVDPAYPVRVVPEAIQIAEHWRVLGTTLKSRSPQLFEKVFELLVVSCLSSDDDVEIIPESYLIT